MRSSPYSRSPSPECAVEDSAEYWNNQHASPLALDGARRAKSGHKGARSPLRRSASPEVTSAARLSFDAPSRSTSPEPAEDVVLSTNERLCATTMAAMCVQVFRGVMTTRDMALGVIAMWMSSLATRAAFGNGISMDLNTPPPDRVVVLMIKLVFTITRWALMTLVRAPLQTTVTLHRRVWHRAVDEGWDDDCAATVAAKDLADDVRECVTNRDYKDFAKAIANDEGEWDVIASGKIGACTYRMLRGVSAEDREAMKNGIAKFRTEVLMAGVSAEVLFDAQTDLLGRQHWDSTTLHPTQVEREVEGVDFAARDVVYWRLRYPRLMAPRDYIVARRQWRDSKNNTLTCISRDALSAPSALNAMKVLQRGMGCKAVDVKRMYSAVMVGPSTDVNGSQYVSIYYEDPGVPPRIAHMAAAKGLDRYMATFEKEIQRRARAGPSRDLSDVPPPPSVERNMASVSFTTGRVSVPQSDDENDDDMHDERGGVASALDGMDSTRDVANTSPHFAPTNASREYRFRGHGGLGKRQRIRRHIGRFVRLMQDLVDPKAAQRQSALFVDDDDDQSHPIEPMRGRRRRWLKRAALGALVWVSRGDQGSE